MSLPPSYNTVEVRGKYVDLAGVPVAGRITFTASAPAMRATGDLTTVIGKPISVDLVAGAFALQIPATNDPDIDPQGFTYTVDEKFVGGLAGRRFSMTVPISAQADGIDITLVAPVAPGVGTAKPFLLDELGDVNVAGAATGSIIRRQPDGSWAAVALPFATTDQLAHYMRLEQAAAAPELIIVGEIARDPNGAALAADVVWPDGTPGAYTATASDAHPGAVDTYSITYGSPAERTYVQPTVTRNTDGAVTFRPPIVVT